MNSEGRSTNRVTVGNSQSTRVTNQGKSQEGSGILRTLFCPLAPGRQNLHGALKKSLELLRLHADTLRGPFLPFDHGNESGFSELHSIFVRIHRGTILLNFSYAE
jgi:hypothetical protein